MPRSSRVGNRHAGPARVARAPGRRLLNKEATGIAADGRVRCGAIRGRLARPVFGGARGSRCKAFIAIAGAARESATRPSRAAVGARFFAPRAVTHGVHAAADAGTNVVSRIDAR